MSAANRVSFPKPQGDLDSGLFAYFARHGTAANILMLMTLLFGVYAILNIRTQFFPDVEVNSVRLNATWEGAPAADVDESLIRPLQTELRLLDEVDSVVGVAREGSASVTVTFKEGVDADQAQIEVQNTLNGTNALPDGVETPELIANRFLDGVSRIVFSADGDLAFLIDRAERMQTELYDEGLEQIDITGVRIANVQVELDPARLRELKLTPREIANAIRSRTQDSPGGAIEDGARTLRTEATRLSVRDFETLIVKRLPTGEAITLREVATVSKGFPGEATEQFRNLKPAIELIVQRGANGDAVRQQAIIERYIEETQPTLPDGASIENYAIQADAIKARIMILTTNGLMGAGIVFMLLLVFLNFRTAIWVAVGIPVSLSATLAVMYFSGQSLNMISMFALIISLGIIVDDALVVGEHAYELKARGYGPRQAAVAAARRMAGPVLAASITTIIAFSTLLLLDGRLGSIVGVMPLAVGAVVIASLIECFLILPSHMSHALSAREPRKRTLGVRMRSAINRGVDWVRYTAFPPFVRMVLVVRYPLIVALFIGVLLSTGLVRNGTVAWTFFSFPESNSVTSNLTMVEVASRDDTIAQLGEMELAVERAISKLNENADTPASMGDVEMVLTTFGLHQGFRGYSTPDVETHRVGSIRIEMVDSDLRSFTTFDFQELWRAEIRQSPLVEDLSSRRGRRGGGAADGITVLLKGEDVEQLKAAAEDLAKAAEEIEAITETSDDTAYGDPELELKLTELGERLGFDATSVGSQVSDFIRTIEATSFVEDGDEIAVEVALPEALRTLTFLRTLELTAPSGALVPLKEVVTIDENIGFRRIRSENSDRQITVTLTYDEEASAASDVAATLERDVIPILLGSYDFDYEFGGDLADEKDFQLSAVYAGIAAIAGIYLCVAWVFGSFLRPLVIMLVIPLGIVGMVIGHWVHDISLTAFSIIGLIGLSGIIVNDSIVLVSTIDERRKTEPTIKAIVYGTADRLRAVFLTTVTTVGGLTPLLFETSRQAQFLKPTVVTITWGLGVGTILLLLFVPAAIMVQADFAAHWNRFKVMLAVATGRRSRLGRDTALGV